MHLSLFPWKVHQQEPVARQRPETASGFYDFYSGIKVKNKLKLITVHTFIRLNILKRSLYIIFQ